MVIPYRKARITRIDSIGETLRLRLSDGVVTGVEVIKGVITIGIGKYGQQYRIAVYIGTGTR